MAESLQGRKKLSGQPVKAAAIAVVVTFAVAIAFAAALAGLDALAKQQTADPFGYEISAKRASYFLLIGSDDPTVRQARGKTDGAAADGRAEAEAEQHKEHADVITLMRIDPNSYTITLVTIPSGTVVEGDKSTLGQLLDEGGAEAVCSSVERLTGVDVDAYLLIAYEGFERLVDSLGGIRVPVEQAVETTDPITGASVVVTESTRRWLSGASALALARACEDYPAAYRDALRQKNVRAIERAIIQKAFSYQAELRMSGLIRVFETSVTTNLDISSAGPIAMDFARHAGAVSIYTCTGPYKLASAGKGKTSANQGRVSADLDAWKAIMAVVEAGEDPAGIVKEPSF